LTRPKNQSRYPVSSFGPELMALLIKGTKEEVRVPCETRKQMRALQARIHQLRGAMGRERHPQYAVVTRARTSQSWKIGANDQPHDWALIVRPQDSQFASILKKAGVEVEPGDAELLTEPTKGPASTPSVEIPVVAPPDVYGKFK
jgi:hypothetical protein